MSTPNALLATLEQHLSTPWPKNRHAATSLCHRTVGLIRRAQPPAAWLDEQLSQMSHENWWALWLYAKKDAGAYVVSLLMPHMISRRPHLYANSTLIDQVLAPTRPVLPREGQLLVLDTAMDGPDPWRTQDPAAICSFATPLFIKGHILQIERDVVLLNMWTELIETRAELDTAPLTAASHTLWSVMPKGIRPRAWATLMTLLGHTPSLLAGFEGSSEPDCAAAALKHIGKTPSPNPVPLGLIISLAQAQNPIGVVDFLCHVATNQGHDNAWVVSVVTALWAKSGLSEAHIREVECADDTTGYTDIVLGLAARGLTDEFARLITQDPHATPDEAHKMVQALTMAPTDNVHTTLSTLLSVMPPETRADLMMTFAHEEFRSCAVPHQPLLKKAVLSAWPLIPAANVDALLKTQPFLSEMPELTALRSQQDLEEQVQMNQNNRGPMKM